MHFEFHVFKDISGLIAVSANLIFPSRKITFCPFYCDFILFPLISQ